jgi:hypothetical protein
MVSWLVCSYVCKPFMTLFLLKDYHYCSHPINPSWQTTHLKHFLTVQKKTLGRLKGFWLTRNKYSNIAENFFSNHFGAKTFIFLSLYFSQWNTMTMHIMFWQQHCTVHRDPKTLHPDGIRTRELLFCRRTRWPLCHATKAWS